MTAAYTLGRVRPATIDEVAEPTTVFRPDAVLALDGAVPVDVSVLEHKVAALIDGVRPIARVRKKSGASLPDLRIAIAGLRDRGLLVVVGVVEEAAGELAADIEADRREDSGNTMPRGTDLIPAHVMAEIQSMVDEAEKFAIDEPTDVYLVSPSHDPSTDEEPPS